VMGAGGRSTELAKGDERAVLGQVNHARWTGNATILDLAVSGSRQIEHFLGWGNSSGHPLYVTRSPRRLSAGRQARCTWRCTHRRTVDPRGSGLRRACRRVRSRGRTRLRVLEKRPLGAKATKKNSNQSNNLI